ncbi:hypothetical protein HHK36_010130 [Tetracentron sinense]|uniref:Embryo defective 2219 n=1 Tax=Tetracentron sinense TaxID=13715 RepID=A0A835DMB1_TETSI|nr:hypothetical protein HHK36_010130 [Tetracentron sinense]
MLFCPLQQHRLQLSVHVSGSLRHWSYSNTVTLIPFPTTVTGCPKPLFVSSAAVDQTAQKFEEENSTGTDEKFRRTHNARSTSFLLRRLSEEEQVEESKAKDEEAETITEEEKVKLLELSLVRRRTPQFPGSIYIQSQIVTGAGASPPPLRRLFQGRENEEIDDDKMLMQALEIRRKVTAEILKEAMRGGKFSITYSTNLVSILPDFVDHVMIEAASMKTLPEFSHSTFNARAKTFIHSSKVVPLIRFLKHNSLTYPQIGKLICMSNGNLESIRRLVEWLKLIYVKGRFLGVALVKAGGAVLNRSTEELDEIVGYLESNGVRRDWMGFVVSRCPKLLSYTMEEVRSRVKFYMDMGMNKNDFGTMVFDYPKALGSLTLEEMNCKVKYLKEFGLSNEDVGQLLAFKPQLMGCSIEERWKPLVKYLYYLGVNRDGMRRMLTIKPMVFCVDLETTIAPKVQFLKDIGIQEDAIGGMLVKFPPLLTYSLYKKIRPVIIFLMTKAGVTQRDIGKVIALGPELLGCSIVNKLEVNVKYFLSLGISLRLLGEMIADFPMLLRYNLNVLRPKYSYLRRTMVRPLQDLIEFPRFFSYSLEGRIIPRHKVLVENRINFKLRYMLASTDQDFDQKVDAAVERRQRFESGVMDDPVSTSPTIDSSIAIGREEVNSFESENAQATVKKI